MEDENLPPIGGLGAREVRPAIWLLTLFRWFDDGIWDDAAEWKDAA